MFKWFQKQPEKNNVFPRDPLPHKTERTERESRRAAETRAKLTNLFPSPDLNPVLVTMNEQIRNDYRV